MKRKRARKQQAHVPYTTLVGAGYMRARRAAVRSAAYSTGELKFHDLDIDSTNPVPTAGEITEDSCLGIAQGTGESDRIGRKILVRAINWKFNVTLNATNDSATGFGSIRVILYQDKQTNGATATVTDILESADWQSFNNLSNAGRFIKLMDKTYSLNSTAASGQTASDASSGHVRSYTFYKKCILPIEYSAGTGAITELRSNNIGVLAISQAARCRLQGKMRIRFSDK